MVVILAIFLLFLFLALGMPVAFALGTVGTIGLYMEAGYDSMLNLLTTVPYRSIASNTIATVPLFILMAEFVNQGGLARELFDAARKILGRLRGGLGIATVFASAGFGALSGSSTAASATMARITIPEFTRLGYNLSTSTGIVSVAGTLSILIPPSIPLIIYGIMTENSIGKLLIAGILPGILTVILYSIGIFLWAFKRPDALPRSDSFSLKEKLSSLKQLWGIILIVLIVLVALYSGFATSTEIAAIGATVTLLFLLLARRIDGKGIYSAVKATIRTSVMILTIIIGAMIFGYFLTVTQVPQNILTAIEHSGWSNIAILLIVLLLYLVLGFFMDQMAILLITLPLTYPLMTALGYDPIWFGIMVVKMVEIGLVTPPVGMNVFVVSGTTGIPVGTVFRGTGILLVFELISILFLMVFPQIVTWLPSLMN